MAKQQQKPKTGKSTTVDMKDGRVYSSKNGNFTVKQNGITVKPTKNDSTMYNTAVKSANAMQKASFKKPLLADTLKKKVNK